MALVTFTDPVGLADYRHRNLLPYPILRDHDCGAYRAFGLDRGSVWRVWGWRALARYAQLVGRGGWRDLRAPVEDTLQLGGDFVIDRAGRLAWGHWGAGPDDRPDVDDLIAAARAAAATRG